MKFILSIFVALATLVFPAAQAATLVPDTKAALVDYIVESKNPADAKTAKQIVDAAFKYGDQYDVDPFLILSVIKAESNFNPKARNRSSATGLMQVIPYWHRDKIKGRSLFNIGVAVEVGTQVLQEYLVMNKDNLRKAMRKYSGGASDAYHKRIQVMHAELRRAVAIWQFNKERSIVVPSYGEVRSWHAAARDHVPLPTPTVAALPPVPMHEPSKDERSFTALVAMYTSVSAQ